jgi:hypothetical protein
MSIAYSISKVKNKSQPYISIIMYIIGKYHPQQQIKLIRHIEINVTK